MNRVRPPLGLTCPSCNSEMEAPEDVAGEVHRLSCRSCGETFKVRRRGRPMPVQAPPVVGGLALFLRLFTLRMVPPIYYLGLGIGSTALFLMGGFLLIIRAWMADRVAGPGGVVEALGGVLVPLDTRDPDNDFGPVLRRLDAPRLFDEVAEVARRLGVRPPEEVRLAFLPCCGVVAWRSSRALLLGMPLLHVLTISELRAILSHELAHLARGDATWSAGSLRFVEGLGRSLEDPSSRAWGPLGLWARFCLATSRVLIGPISRGQEARADRTSAAMAGGQVAASALVKVALIQPLFRELLELHEAGAVDGLNLYSTFRAFWVRLPGPLLESMRLRLLTIDSGPDDSTHPPLPDRVAMVQSYPDLAEEPGSNEAAWTLMADPEWLEQMLDDRLYGLAAVEPTIFHKAGT